MSDRKPASAMAQVKARSTENHADRPLAVWVYRQLRSDADRRFVYEVLCERLTGGSDSTRDAMREAMSACVEEIGLPVPSAAQYERWRTTSSGAYGAPTIGQLRTAFGSWSQALAALLGTPEADPTVRRLLATRRPFTQEQALRGVCEFLKWLPGDETPRAVRYFEWAATLEPDSYGCTDVPRSPATITRAFGSWRAALRAAGADLDRVQTVRRRRKAKFTRQDAVEALRAAQLECGEPLSQARYDLFVRERDRALGDDQVAAPRAQSVGAMFGGWRCALKHVFGAHVLLSRGSPNTEYTREELIAAYRACEKDVGGAPSQIAYDGWRYTKMQRGETDNFVPFSHTLTRRIGEGSWSRVAAALGVEVSRSRRSRREFSDGELVAFYRECAEDLGHLPTQKEYDRWRERKLAVGATTNVPFSNTLIRRLGRGAWRPIASAIDAHLLGFPPSPALGRRRWSSRELEAVWERCQAEVGRRPTMAVYTSWRAQRLAELPACLIPDHKTLTRWLGSGSWRNIAADVHLPKSQNERH